MLSHSAVELFRGCETLPQVIQRNGIEWWTYIQALLAIRTKVPGYVGPRRQWSPLPSARPDCGDLDLRGPLPPARPVSSAIPTLVSPSKARRRVSFPGLLPGALGDPPAGAFPFGILDLL